MMKTVLLLLLLFCLVVPVSAMEIGGIQMPDTLKLDGQNLVLNGAGLRTKFFFTIYAGGLYLPRPSADATAVIGADEPMLVRMHFIYDGVSGKKLQDGWKDGFKRTAPEADEKLQAAMAAFIDLFSKEVKKNDIYEIAWTRAKKVEVRLNNVLQGTISSLAFKKALFAIWLGREPVDDDLKEGMLGR